MAQSNYTESYLGQLRGLIGKKRIIINAVRAVVYNQHNHLLLIRRRDNKRWAMPAGAMELDESVYECLVREVREESGLDVHSATLFAIWSNPGKTTIVTHYGDPYQLVVFIFRVDEWTGELVTQTDETIDAGFFSMDELPEIAQHYHETIEDLGIYEKECRLILK